MLDYKCSVIKINKSRRYFRRRNFAGWTETYCDGHCSRMKCKNRTVRFTSLPAGLGSKLLLSKHSWTTRLDSVSWEKGWKRKSFTTCWMCKRPLVATFKVSALKFTNVWSNEVYTELSQALQHSPEVKARRVKAGEFYKVHWGARQIGLHCTYNLIFSHLVEGAWRHGRIFWEQRLCNDYSHSVYMREQVGNSRH